MLIEREQFHSWCIILDDLIPGSYTPKQLSLVPETFPKIRHGMTSQQMPHGNLQHPLDMTIFVSLPQNS